MIWWHWLVSSQGQAAAAAIQRLAQSLLADCPRRGRRLVIVGPDPGVLCSSLWAQDFHLTLAAPDPAILAMVRERRDLHVDLHLVKPDHLPWPDDTFDVAVSFCAITPSNGNRHASEMLRVTRSVSLFLFGDRLALLRPLQAAVLPWGGSWWGTRRLLRRLTSGSTRSASVLLPSSRATWQRHLPLLPPGIGPCCGIAHDIAPYAPLTPILSFGQEAKAG